jgi:hypothetical protein
MPVTEVLAAARPARQSLIAWCHVGRRAALLVSFGGFPSLRRSLRSMLREPSRHRAVRCPEAVLAYLVWSRCV